MYALLTAPAATEECTNCGGMFELDDLVERPHGYWCAPCDTTTLSVWEAADGAYGDEWWSVLYE